MFAVFLCGCTDCFLHALFMSEEDADTWVISKSKNPEGYIVKFYDLDDPKLKQLVEEM